MEQNSGEKRRAEPVRLWVHTVALSIAALSPIVVELIQLIDN